MGFIMPDSCPRNRTDCEPLSQLMSDGDNPSFYCCGENDGTNRPVNQDKYTVCFRGPHRDEMSFNDKRDLTHNASVLIQALAIIEEEDCVAYHEEPEQ